MDKPGYKTSELYIAIATIAVVALVCLVGGAGQAGQLVGMIITVLTALGYTASRTLAKHTNRVTYTDEEERDRLVCKIHAFNAGLDEAVKNGLLTEEDAVACRQEIPR